MYVFVLVKSELFKTASYSLAVLTTAVCCVYTCRHLPILLTVLVKERKFRMSNLYVALCFSCLSFPQSKKAFMKASEEADAALQAFQKADQDMANSRLVIEKVNQFSVWLFYTSVSVHLCRFVFQKIQFCSEICKICLQMGEKFETHRCSVIQVVGLIGGSQNTKVSLIRAVFT